MPDIVVTNPNFEGSSITVNVNLVSIVPKGEAGDHKYIFAIGTSYKDKNGNAIIPIFVNTTSVAGFWEALPDSLENICDQINWGTHKTDNTKPYVDHYSPEGSNVSLYSAVMVNIKDTYPSAGIDTDSIKMYINDIEVTDDLLISGEYTDLKLIWNPKKRILK